MVVDRFNMVDMGNVDIVNSQGIAIPGLYQRLVESIALCSYTILYNWKFNDILIPPTSVRLTRTSGGVKINDSIEVGVDNVIHVSSLEPTPYVPVIVEGLFNANGTYQIPQGVDGYGPVIVDVPSTQPVIVQGSFTSNGTYLVPANVDGYNPVIVNVPDQLSLLMQQGQVSTTSAYATAYFNSAVDFTLYDWVSVEMYRGGDLVGVGSVLASAIGNLLNFNIIGGAYTYEMTITPDYISCRRYSGSYVNLYVDVYGVKK